MAPPPPHSERTAKGFSAAVERARAAVDLLVLKYTGKIHDSREKPAFGTVSRQWFAAVEEEEPSLALSPAMST
jgi:hypothetical protein